METANGISGRLVLVSNHHACVPLLPLIYVTLFRSGATQTLVYHSRRTTESGRASVGSAALQGRTENTLAGGIPNSCRRSGWQAIGYLSQAKPNVTV
jgi:hypothetical protein